MISPVSNARRNLDQVAADDVEAAERSDELQNLVAGKSADLRRACAGSVGGIDAVDVERHVGRLVLECAKMAQHRPHSFFVEFLGGDHADFVFARKIEIVFGIDLAAQANLQDSAVAEKAFLEGAAERRAVRILAAEIFVPEIVVRVELNQVHRAAVVFRDRAKDRKADRVVAANARVRAPPTRIGVMPRSMRRKESSIERGFTGRSPKSRDAIFLEGIEL